MTFVFAIAFAIGAIWYFGYEVTDFSQTRRGAFSITMGLVVVGVFMTSFLWFPVMSCFIMRDLWLRHVIQMQLKSTDCPGCGYQLLGLTIEDDEHSQFVICPECGYHIELNTGHIMDADIDPKLLRCS